MATDTPAIVLATWRLLVGTIRRERAALILSNIHARRISGAGYIPTR